MNIEGELAFLRTYKDFIYNFNMLERNIGYCLRHCSTKEKSRKPEKWLSASFDSKVKKLMALAEKYGTGESFSDWYLHVQQCRHLRNIISHGSWEWKWWLPEPIHFHAPEMENGKGAFTTEAFDERLVYLKNVDENFRTLRTSLEIAVEKGAQQIGDGNAVKPLGNERTP